MYSQLNVHERFADNAPAANNSDHLIAVTHSNDQWFYDNGSSSVHAFTPNGADVLIASVDFSSDTITAMSGYETDVHGIQAGFATSDLTFLADRFNGNYDNGEFTVNGTTFSTTWEAPNLAPEISLLQPVNN